MRRILVAERSDGQWGFDREGAVVLAASPLLAAIEARRYGDALEGRTPGYLIRLDPGGEGDALITLHSRIFGDAATASPDAPGTAAVEPPGRVMETAAEP
ncbi:hypothetical protein [Dokdonella koreensis]|uniref:hypothetical protein n=1 Tax=Dokdonella koreensis TaxID=323415 RepID=UPI000833A58D|nr:hypothetical protein [Dokdonella koreensis]